jgi:hypothetical protein
LFWGLQRRFDRKLDADKADYAKLDDEHKSKAASGLIFDGFEFGVVGLVGVKLAIEASLQAPEQQLAQIHDIGRRSGLVRIVPSAVQQNDQAPANIRSVSRHGPAPSTG